MIRKKITFVLGAGASAPYGFPVGSELVLEILWVCRAAGAMATHKGLKIGELSMVVCDAMAEHNGVDREEAKKQMHLLGDDIDRVKPMSIDRYLARHPKWDELGRLLIAAVLLEHERQHSLMLGAIKEGRGDWYRYLMELLDAPHAQFAQNNVSFVTFNYDRTLEQSLTQAFSTQEDLSPREWQQTIYQNVWIAHVHGRLGVHPQFPEAGQKSIPYGEPPTADSLVVAAAGIQIVSDEGLINSPEFAFARRLLKDAKAIFFLGFAYDSVNLRHLEVRLHCAHKDIAGTAFTLTDAEKMRIHCLMPVEDKKPGDWLAAANQDCLSLLRSSPLLQMSVE